ncbi:uncharacterized protein LOC116416528 [Nasonia vitripennis]|uniref:Uncharacterized protein n=1 Tax=Nasonia vitripennis TaxID=7425 RepID=A0A7M7Q6M7_NASVI|nr:uncharacterized protein LOC116416528 [Nasonia vitripennis]
MPYSLQFVEVNNYMSIDDEILFSTFDLEYYNGVSKMPVGISIDETNEYDEILKSLPTPSASEPCSLSKSESCPNLSVPITPSYITPALSSPILYNALTNPRKPILKSIIPVNIPLPFNKK